MKKYKIGYFGTPYFSADFLKALLEDPDAPVEVSFVMTQPDKPVGKKQIVTPSPVKQILRNTNIPVFEQIKELEEQKKMVQNCDFCLVFAYGFRQLIPPHILKLPKIMFRHTQSGFLNIHPSLLPKYRGASPIAYPLILGDAETGVSIFVMDEKMDHGPVIIQKPIKIYLTDTRTGMEHRLTRFAYGLFTDLLRKDPETIEPVPQNHAFVTRAPYMIKNDGFVSYEFIKSAIQDRALQNNEQPELIKKNNQYIDKTISLSAPLMLWNMFRGLSPWPGIWTLIHDDSKEKTRRLKIIDMEYKNGKIRIKKVKLEGKREVDFETFRKAYGVFI